MISERSFNIVFSFGIVLWIAIALASDNPYWITLTTRALILGLAGIGLNIALGYGGLVSFGHAAYFGIGGYVMAILTHHTETFEPLFNGLLNGTNEMSIILLVAMLVGGLAALVIGALSLRTAGAYFIMITLAFAQMLYYFGISWYAYGGEDGISLIERNTFFGIDISETFTFFIVVMMIVAVVLFITHRLNISPFGLALNGARQNEERVHTFGINVFALRLGALTTSGVITAVAGVLYANLNLFVSPTMLSWHVSGEIMIFVILGGIARLFGPLTGAVLFVLLEEVLGEFSEYWQIYLGLLLLLVVFYAHGGIVGLISKKLHSYYAASK